MEALKKKINKIIQDITGQGTYLEVRKLII